MATIRQLEEATSESPNELTIEELAAQTGLSVRNIRSHHARGLLAPPEVRMRVGYYGPAHLSQLRLIRELYVREGDRWNALLALEPGRVRRYDPGQAVSYRHDTTRVAPFAVQRCAGALLEAQLYA